MFSSPAVAGDFAYIGSHSGRLIAIDLTKRRVAWQFETGAAKSTGPAYTAADGTPKYAAAFAGNFYDDLVVGVDRGRCQGHKIIRSGSGGRSVIRYVESYSGRGR